MGNDKGIALSCMVTIETKIFHVQALHYSFLSNLVSCHLEQQSENNVIKQATAMAEVLVFRVWQRLKANFSTFVYCILLFLSNLISCHLEQQSENSVIKQATAI